MSMAWETTTDDIELAVNCSSELAEEIFDLLNFDEVESAALYGDEMDEQVDLANNEIRRQVKTLIDDGELETEEELNLEEKTFEV